jgi:hypothetical protein
MRFRYLEREDFNIISAQQASADKLADDDNQLPTRTSLLKQRKEEFLEYNRKTFADIQTVLPRFSDE